MKPILAASIPPSVIVVAIVAVLILFSVILFILSRYRRCPSDKVMVIYGKVGTNKDGTARSAKCIHGGAAFIKPIVQAYEYMDLTPMSISVDLKNALSRQNIRIDVPARFTVGISTEPGTMQNAAERLLGLKLVEVQELAKDIIFGQMRLIIATMQIEEINTDRDKFLEAVSSCVESELRKIGLRLINVNVTDISDESGYIEALGKEAAAKAINEARIQVAERNREGSIGEANAVRDQRISVAEAEQSRRLAKGEADAIYAKMEAQARGIQEILSKQAAGFSDIVKAAGSSQEAVQLLLADKIEELTKIQVEAVKNLNIDKITVWDSMNGEGGSPTTANFLSGMMKSIPPISETFKMAGLQIPAFLGKELEEKETVPAEDAADKPET